MTEKYLPRDGDRVRATATVTGIVERHRFGGFSVVPQDPGRDIWTFDDSEVDDPDWTFEKLPDPLPTTPGSVIRLKSGAHYILTAGGWWCWSRGSLVKPKTLGCFPYDVIHDAGKVES